MDNLASAINRYDVAFVRAPWNEEAIQELKEAPNGTHDDIIDAMTDCHAEVALAPMFRFPFDPALHVYDTQFFQDSFGGSESERSMLMDPHKFSRWGAFIFATSSVFIGSWMLYFAKSVDGIVYVYDELPQSGSTLRDQAEAIQAKNKEWNFDGRPTFCSKELSGRDSDGLSRWTKFSQLGLTFYDGRTDRIEGYSSIEHAFTRTVKGDPGLMIHERCKFLRAYLESTPRDPRRPEDVDPLWVGAPAIEAMRLGIHTMIRTPS